MATPQAELRRATDKDKTIESLTHRCAELERQLAAVEREKQELQGRLRDQERQVWTRLPTRLSFPPPLCSA